MAMTPEITLKISADVASLNTALNSTAKSIDVWSKQNLGGFAEFGKSIGMLAVRFSAMVAPIAAAGAAIYGIAQKAANAGDELLKTSQQIGISVEKLSGLKYAAELSNANLEVLSIGVKNLSKNITEANTGTGEASDTFKALGIEFKDANGKIKPTDEILLSLADKFSNMEDGAGKTALAMKVLGRNGLELLPFMNKGRDGLKELTDEAKEMGNTFTTSGAKSANQFNDTITKLKKILEGLVNSIGKNLIPMFNDYFLPAIQSITKAFSWLTSQVIGGFMGALEMTGSVLGGWAARVAIVFDWVKSGFKGGFGELKKQFEIIGLEVDKELEKIAFKWSGKSIAEGPAAPAKKKTTAPVIKDSKEEEKFRKEAFEKEKKHNELIANNWRATTKRLKDEDEKYKDDRIKLRDEELQAMVEAEQKQLDINSQLKEETLNNQMSLMSEKERLDTEYLLKKAEMEKAGIYDMKALTEWYYSEIQVLGEKASTKPDSFLQKIQKEVDSFAKALTGSTSSTEGLGAMVDSIVGLIKTITNLPKILNELLKGLFTNLKHFPRELVNLIKDVLVNLPNILLELIVTVFTELIPILVSEIPNMIIKMISGLFEAIKTLIFGGEIKSTIDGWTQDASNQSVTVQLDTSNAMSALKQAQEALLGAVNETDRKVAREALLSARSAAILAEQKQRESQQQAQPETKRFEGIFGMIGNIFNNLWKALEDIFGNAWVGLAAVLLAARILQKVWDIARLALVKAWDTVYLALVKAWDTVYLALVKAWDTVYLALVKAWDTAWLALEKAWDMEWLGLKKVADLEFITAFTLAGVAIVAAFVAAMVVFKNEMDKKFEDFARSFIGLLGTAGEQGIQSIATAMGGGNHEGPFAKREGAMTIAEIQNYHNELYRAPNYEEAKKIMVRYGFTISDEEGQKRWWEGLKRQAGFHSGGLIKAHSGMYLKDDEVPIIAQFGEGILNKYKGMTAIGGEAGLNFANRYGSLPGTGKTEINNNQTYHQHFEVVVDKDGNVMKLTRTQAKNLARTLDPVFKEMKRNRELSFV